MTLSIIIVSYNVKFFLEQCLRSCIKSTQNIEVEIIVVDNNSVDETVSMVKEKFPSVSLICNRKNVGFSRANLFGKNFKEYFKEAQKPIIVAMIESVQAIDNLDLILKVKGLDAVLIGPYDLSASMNIAGEFEKKIFLTAIDKIRSLAIENSVAYGIHVVDPDVQNLENRIEEGYQFIAYSIDSVFLSKVCENPIKSQKLILKEL